MRQRTDYTVKEKECNVCHRVLPAEMFRRRSWGYITTKCRPCERVYQKKYDDLRPRKEKNHLDQSGRIRNKLYVANYVATHPCVDCGNSDPRVLEFDHVRGVKKYEMGTLRNSAHALQRIIDEIAKCEIRCANCHRIRHMGERDNIHGFHFIHENTHKT